LLPSLLLLIMMLPLSFILRWHLQQDRLQQLRRMLLLQRNGPYHATAALKAAHVLLNKYRQTQTNKQRQNKSPNNQLGKKTRAQASSEAKDITMNEQNDRQTSKQTNKQTHAQTN